MKIQNIRVEQMTSNKSGREVANQFIIHTPEGVYFQSYRSIIAFVPNRNAYDETCEKAQQKTVLDEQYWDYSRTTGKYRNAFLGENTAETRKKIKSGEYILSNLNK